MKINSVLPLFTLNKQQNYKLKNNHFSNLSPLWKDTVTFTGKSAISEEDEKNNIGPEINYDWVNNTSVRTLIENIVKSSSPPIIDSTDLINILNYFGYVETKRHNGHGRIYESKAYPNYIFTVRNKYSNLDMTVTKQLKDAFLMINKTNGELIPNPKNKQIHTPEEIEDFTRATKEYKPEGENKYRKHLEEYKTQIKAAQQPTFDTLTGAKREQKAKIKALIKDIDSIKNDLNSIVGEINCDYKEFSSIYELLKENNDDRDKAVSGVINEILKIYGQITEKAEKLNEINTGEVNNRLLQDEDDKLSLDELSSIYNKLLQWKSELDDPESCLEIIELQDVFSDKMKAFQEGLNKVTEKRIDGIPKKAKELVQRIDSYLPYLTEINSAYNQIVDVLKDDDDGAINEYEYKSKLNEFKSKIDSIHNVLSGEKKEDIKRIKTNVQKIKESGTRNADIYRKTVSFEKELSDLENQMDNAIGKQSEKIIDFLSEIMRYYNELLVLDRFNPEKKLDRRCKEVIVKLKELNYRAVELMAFMSRLVLLKRYYNSRLNDPNRNVELLLDIKSTLVDYDATVRVVSDTEALFDEYRTVKMENYDISKKGDFIKLQKKIGEKIAEINKYYKNKLNLTDADFAKVKKIAIRVEGVLTSTELAEFLEHIKDLFGKN